MCQPLKTGELFKYLVRYFSFSMQNFEHNTILLDTIGYLLTELDCTPYHQKNKHLLCHRFVLSLVSWNFTIEDLRTIVVVENLANIVGKYVERWFELGLSEPRVDNRKHTSADNYRSSCKGLRIASYNIVSLSKHKNELETLINDQNLDVIGLNERRLERSIPNSVVNMNEYIIYRKDRNAAGGGVATSVRETLRHSQRIDISDSDLEIICIEVMPKNAKNFIILCWYRPPTNDLSTASFNAFLGNFKQIRLGRQRSDNNWRYEL